MPTPHALRVLALSPAFVASAFALTLTGNQDAATVTLEKGSHTLKGAYVVPAGKKLEIKPGALITTVEKGAALTVHGELVVSGDATGPVVFKGAKWRGVRVESTGTASITGLQVTGAEVAFDMQGTVTKFESCVFSKNTKGAKLDGKGAATVSDCLFFENVEDGLRITGGMKATVSNCSFVRNRRYGVSVGESNPKFEHCVFLDNVAAGLEQSNASGATSMSGTGCSFDGKGVSILSGISHGSLDFQKCYWGDKATAYLKSKGDKGAIPNLKDARAGGGSLKVYLLGFLSSAPKPCGATVTSKL